jgi:hypothetical protein
MAVAGQVVSKDERHHQGDGPERRPDLHRTDRVDVERFDVTAVVGFGRRHAGDDRPRTSPRLGRVNPRTRRWLVPLALLVFVAVVVVASLR